MTTKVTEVYFPEVIKREKLKVAAYCRVSSAKEKQLHSLYTQIRYFRDKINSTFNWELVDIYAEAKSGRAISLRPEFQRMISDCKECKLNCILISLNNFS